MFRSHRAKGVILATMYRQELTGTVLDDTVNVIMANCSHAGRASQSVLPDDTSGGYLQAQHIFGLGHHRVSVISLSRDVTASALRNAGIQASMQEHGIDPSGVSWFYGIDGLPRDERYTAFEHAVEVLFGPDRPTAIICGNDRIAMLVYCAAARLGLRVPEDLSVIGFDDFSTISEGLRPELTTVNLPYYEMGRRAVKMVLEPPDDQGDAVIVPCALVKRHSCGPPSF
jgi:LacI family transcriptional regulator